MPTFLPFGGGDGAEVIYALRNTNKLANLILDELSIEGQNVRKAYQRRLPSDTSKDYYFIHRQTGNTEPVIVEYGFLDSPLDDINQLKNNYENYAEAVVRAITNYIDTSYVPVPGGNYYVINKGDSLWSIAKKFSISVEELKAANNLSSSLLSIGQTLRIPSKEQAITDESTVYIVKSGDSLYKIANQYNLTVQELIDFNNLSSTYLSVGQRLLIPVEIVSIEDYLSYIVKSGDSLYSIAREYNTSVSDIKKLNNLTTNSLSVGQDLKIPVGEEVIEPTTSMTDIEYVVKSGDSLYSIARKYNISVNELMNYNDLNTTILNIGQILRIPTSNDEEIYVVKSGDNLYGIAREYNTTVDKIKSKNNLTSNSLSIGQLITIPKEN